MYTNPISRATPGCFLFLIDQSASMLDPIAGTGPPKIDIVRTAVNQLIAALVVCCEKGAAKPFHYFDVGLIGYSTDQNGEPIVDSALGGLLSGRDLVSIVELSDHQQHDSHSDPHGQLVYVPVWYRPPPPDWMGGTPMCAALRRAREVAAGWAAAHWQSFPPVVIHLTDGESTDGDPEPDAHALRGISTGDGEVLLFNCHLSGSAAHGVLFPVAEAELADPYGQLLFRMSSPLPPPMLAIAAAKHIPARPGSRAMAFNADGSQLVHLLNVGTIVTRTLPQNPRALR